MNPNFIFLPHSISRVWKYVAQFCHLKTKPFILIYCSMKKYPSYLKWKLNSFKKSFFIHSLLPFQYFLQCFLLSAVFQKVNSKESILIDDSVQMNKEAILVPNVATLKLMLTCQQQENEYGWFFPRVSSEGVSQVLFAI